MCNVAVGIVWQLTLKVAPICLVIREYLTLLVSLVVLAATSIVMKSTWYDTLEASDPDPTPSPAAATQRR